MVREVEEAKFPVMLTFDLDAESGFLASDPANASRVGVLSAGKYGPQVGVYRLIELLQAKGVPASLFVPGWVAEKYPEAVQAAAAAGWEIAHHGYHHIPPASQTREEEEYSIARGIEAIAGVTGRLPVGYRSPSWDFSSNTLELLDNHGFLYSSNMMDDDAPYLHPAGQSGKRIVELPIQWLLDDAPFFLFRAPYQRPISALSNAYEHWSEEFEGLYAERERGKCYVLTMHPFISGRPSRVRLLERLIDFIQQHSEVAFYTCEEVATAFAQKQPGKL
ncbi:MAG TPA: polysaccharide deacetylase [Chloroflexia bacterium]|nr:polysaccharide deacetylase [Chloroflexia bacterium]